MADYLLDTNVLLRTVQEQAAQHETAVNALAALAADGHRLFVTPQVLIEFWAVASRSVEDNGLGWSVPQIAHEVEEVLQRRDSQALCGGPSPHTLQEPNGGAPMRAYSTEKVVSEQGTIQLEALPFAPGEVVEVIVLARKAAAESGSPRPLRGSVLRYEDALEPVAEHDWEALR